MREKLAWALVAALGLAIVATFGGIVRGGRSALLVRQDQHGAMLHVLPAIA